MAIQRFYTRCFTLPHIHPFIHPFIHRRRRQTCKVTASSSGDVGLGVLLRETSHTWLSGAEDRTSNLPVFRHHTTLEMWTSTTRLSRYTEDNKPLKQYCLPQALFILSRLALRAFTKRTDRHRESLQYFLSCQKKTAIKTSHWNSLWTGSDTCDNIHSISATSSVIYLPALPQHLAMASSHISLQGLISIKMIVGRERHTSLSLGEPTLSMAIEKCD